MWRDTDWAYFAGLLDGEGSVGVYLRSSRMLGSRQVTPTVNYRPRVSVVNTFEPVLHWIKDELGGSVSAKGRAERHKPAYVWATQRFDQIELALQNALPYLQIKRRQAEIVLEWPWNVACNQWTTSKTAALREQKRLLYEETLRLNRRGVDPDSMDSRRRRSA